VGNTLLSFLSREWAGLPIAAAPALVGGGCLYGGRADGPVWLTWLGGTLLAVAAVMALGSLWHLVHMARVRKLYPPPGRLVDVGGYRIHVLAEGMSADKPAVVWMPGAHAGGYSYHHLHRALREEARSILVDRPGTGWSDVGPFPRTTAREAEEVMAALDGAGERGPFVLVGHSFGGMLVGAIARRYPDRVAALVMVDATPPDTVIYGPPIPVLKQMRRGALLNALPHLLGVHTDLAERRQRRLAPPAWKRIAEIYEERLGEALQVLRAIEGGTRAACAGASIYSELSAEGLARVAWDTVLYEGDLGDMPVLLVAPNTMEEEEFAATAAMIDRGSGLGRPVDRDRLRRFYTRSRERYLTVSKRSRRLVAPAGTGHNFPYETPEFLLDVVRGLLREPETSS
jgi:pimeloyl-ACP methyl ester carboxylesterase